MNYQNLVSVLSGHKNLGFDNRPFATNGHLVQNPSCWRAGLLLFPHWEIQNKKKPRLTGHSRFVLEAVTLLCVPVCRILYHVIVMLNLMQQLFLKNTICLYQV